MDTSSQKLNHYRAITQQALRAVVEQGADQDGIQVPV